jgi:hypothetical protein
MIINTAETLAISNMGWLDGGSLWSYMLGDSRPELVPVSDSKWLSIIGGTNDWFVLIHQDDEESTRLTVHSLQSIAEIASSIELGTSKTKSEALSEIVDLPILGEKSKWSFLPKAYAIRTLTGPSLLLVDWKKGTSEIRTLSWHMEFYDTMYQGILEVVEIPGSPLLLISIQRDSAPVIYDHVKGKVVRKLKLADRNGNPQLFFRRQAPELWASDYDTLVKMDSRSYDVLDTVKLQEGQAGMARSNIGKYYFSPDERFCLVARPHSGDIVIVDPSSFRVVSNIETEGLPEDAGLLGHDHVISRDLKTGHLRQAVLRST